MRKPKSKKQQKFILFWWITTIGSAIFLALMIYFDRISLVSQFIAPSGADPGNWLTTAWEIGGNKIRLTDWAYPPFLFVFLRILLNILNPMDALKITGAFSWSLIGIMFLLITRLIYPRQRFYIQIGVATFIMLAGYQGEIFAWGGYPQLMGMAFLLVVFPALDQWLKTKRKKWLLISILSADMVIYTHHFLAVILGFCIISMAFLVVWDSRQNIKSTIKGWTVFLLPTLVIALPAIVIYSQFSAYLGNIPTNPQQFSIENTDLLFNYVFQNQTIIWFPLIGLVTAFAIWNRKNAFSNTVLLFIGSSLILLFTTWEVRLSQLLIIGVGFGLLLIEQELASNRRTKLLNSIYGIGIMILLILILPAAKDWFVRSSSFYRVVDDDTANALTWIRTNTNPNDVIAASPWSPFLIGWWIQGFAERPSIYATDLRWLVFTKEREYAQVANDLFVVNVSNEKIKQIIGTYNITYLFIDKKQDAFIFDKWITKKLFRIVFENQRVLIFKINQDSISQRK